jgi:hypothetical protein
MNGFLRNITSLAAIGALAVLLAIFSAVAIANDTGSGSGNSGTTTEKSPSDHGGTNTTGDQNRSGGNAGGNSGGEDQAKDNTGDRGNSETHRRDGTGVLSHPGKPKQGKTLNLKPGKGKGKGKNEDKVTVKLPGITKPVALNHDSSVPVGSVIDATHGTVTVNTVPREDGHKQWATFSGAKFQVLQSKTGKPVTEIRLRGGSFASCLRPTSSPSLFGRGAVFATASSKRKVRSLWGRGKGHFRTRGRNGAATVRGTIWFTEDRCDGTFVHVRRGLVAVRDFKKHKTVMVPKGHSYLAKG